MNLIISASPHQKSTLSTPYLMRQVIFALLPATGAALYFYKIQALLIIINCIISSVLTEEIILRIRKRPSCATDFSAGLTGLLLALTLPPGTKWYAATLGSVFAILVAKQLFGGLGYNIFNPALAGRAFLQAAYPAMLTTWTMPVHLSALTQATPLALRKFDGIITPLQDLFVGNVPGCIGETSALLLMLGGAYILIRKIADWRIPLSFALTLGIITSIFYTVNPLNGSVLFHFTSGGLLLGLFFMATDPVSAPMTKGGRFMFGTGCGILIMIIRYFSGLPEGVMYAILFMNALVPLINRYTKPSRYGT